jgi:plastocyanin
VRGHSRRGALALLTLLIAALGALDASAQQGPGSGGGGPKPSPSASFVYSPTNPMAGDTVTFTSTSQASAGSITEVAWDLDGDGEFDDSEEAQATWSFATPGTHSVQLRVRQSNGRRDTAFADVVVAAPPPPPPPPDEPPDALRIMNPFPVIRIAGSVLPRGARIRILSVRGSRGARIRVRCHGRGCPVRAIARTSATRLVRLRRFERRLRAGIRLELFVRRPARIGKYTRFRIRAAAPPRRVDLCLFPGSARPAPCP